MSAAAAAATAAADADADADAYTGHSLGGFAAFLQAQRAALVAEMQGHGLDFFDYRAVLAQVDAVDFVLGRVNDYATLASAQAGLGARA